MLVAPVPRPAGRPLDTSETSSQIPVARRRRNRERRRTVEDQAAYEHARQARRGGQARAVASSYDAIGRGDRAGNVRRCGRVAVYACAEASGCGALHGRRGFQCHDRLCPYCAVLRGRRLAERVAPLVERMARPLFITLTVKNGPDLAERGRHLRKSFSTLRRRQVWRTCIGGGIYVEEESHNGQDGTWHPHGHVIADVVVGEAQLTALAVRAGMSAHVAAVAPYEKRLEAVLRHQWRDITGDSFIVDVRSLDPGDLREACKYTAKLSSIVYSPALVAEFIGYADGRRMVIPFGTCYAAAVDLAAVDEEVAGEVVVDVEDQPCPSCGQVGTLRHQAGRVWALHQLRHVGAGWYAPCSTLDDWRRVVVARAGP